MIPWGWLILGTWLAGIVPTWRKSAWVLANDSRYADEPDGEDIVMGMFIGLLIAAIWPLVVPAYLAYHRGLLTGAFLAPPEHIRKQHELEERERRIRQLEREVGIR